MNLVLKKQRKKKQPPFENLFSFLSPNVIVFHILVFFEIDQYYNNHSVFQLFGYFRYDLLRNLWTIFRTVKIGTCSCKTEIFIISFKYIQHLEIRPNTFNDHNDIIYDHINNMKMRNLISLNLYDINLLTQSKWNFIFDQPRLEKLIINRSDLSLYYMKNIANHNLKCVKLLYCSIPDNSIQLLLKKNKNIHTLSIIRPKTDEQNLYFNDFTNLRRITLKSLYHVPRRISKCFYFSSIFLEYIINYSPKLTYLDIDSPVILNKIKNSFKYLKKLCIRKIEWKGMKRIKFPVLEILKG